MSNDIKHTPVGAIKHQEDKRVMIPTSELAGEETRAIEATPKKAAYQTFKNEFERGRDPELFWLNKYQNDSEDTESPELKVDVRSLYVHEDIQPEMLINRLYKMKEEKKNPLQRDLFSFDELGNNIVEDELERVADYYHHQTGWKNRLIQGDSLLVMNSLLKREGMAGKVQCLYFDPPYGIKYGSNWQMKLNNTSIADGKDDNLSGEPEMIKAFRDTWEFGIHSYLQYLRDRLVVARELLSNTGSVFVQISDDNAHLVRCLLDEIFGSENFVSQLVYQKTTGAGSPGELTAPASVNDYILWYAKNREKYKFRKLFALKEFGKEGSSAYKKIELADGTRMSISEWEKTNKKKFDYNERPSGSRVYALDNLTSQSGGENARFPIVFEGKIYNLSSGSWKTSQAGIEELIKQRRIDASSKGGLGYIRYFDDFMAQPVSCLWTDTVGQNQMGGEKLYVVQSAIKPIQRCILMATDPGDLVLDPTCGSGTTAFVSEQWGRRWITIDTSRIAINIAKKRLASALYSYYNLFDKDNGNIRQGFEYKILPHLKLRNIANKEQAEFETLYDQPIEDKSKIRVSGPFTVETLQNYNVNSPESVDDRPDEAEENRLFQERIFSHLTTSGVRNGDKTQQAVFHNVEAVASPFLNAKGYYKDGEGEERLAYFLIGPKFGTVSKISVTQAIKEFRNKNANEGASWLVLLGFSFEDNINEKDYNFGTYTVSKVRMHDDLMQDGLLKKDKKAGSFITIGEPDIIIKKDDEHNCHVEIRGLDIYDPIKDDVKARSVEDIAYWEMDDNYDGNQFIVRSIHFCGGDKKEFDAWRKGLDNLAKASAKTKKNAERTLKLEFEEEAWDALYGFESEAIPFEKGRKVAVRVVSQFGEESSKVLTIED